MKTLLSIAVLAMAMLTLRSSAMAGEYEDYSHESWKDNSYWEEESSYDYGSKDHDYKYSEYDKEWNKEYDNEYSKYSEEENYYHEEGKDYDEYDKHEYKMTDHHEDLDKINWKKLWSWLSILMTHFKSMGMTM